MENKIYVNNKEAAQILGVSAPTWIRLRKKFSIPVIRLENCYRYKRSDIENIIDVINGKSN